MTASVSAGAGNAKRRDLNIRLENIVELPADFWRLEELSSAESFRAMRRMREDWNSGVNRFNEPGEVLRVSGENAATHELRMPNDAMRVEHTPEPEAPWVE
jgi:hypothetical protein